MGTRGSEAEASAGGRLYWVDFAKALAVILVVVYHVTGGMNTLFPTPAGAGSSFWNTVNTIALPLRMPLFFVAAGMLAHSAITRPWSAVVRPRVIALLWPYVLWAVVFALVAGFAYRPDDTIGYAVDRLRGVPFGRAGYWFLLVLALFFVAAKLLRRWAPVVLVIALLISAAAPWLEAHVYSELHTLLVYGVTRVARYGFWYLLGCYGFRYVSRVASAPPLLLAAVGGAVFTALTVFTYGGEFRAPFAFALSVAGVTAMIGISVWVSGFAATRPLSRYLAARTLPIYLIHPMIIVVVVLIGRLLGGGVQPNDALSFILTPVVTVMCIVIAVLIYDRVKESRAAWLFAPPRWPVLSRRS